MKIAIVHYHLRRGGVTRVIQTTLDALATDDVHIAVLSGEPPAEPDSISCPIGIVEGLGYDSLHHTSSSSQLAISLLETARARLGGDPDIWHVHNHSLGKNAALPGALKQLADDGHRLLLHLHDFPEDGRPANYRHLREHSTDLDHTLYPTAGHIHYAALNHRDLSFLRAAGSPQDRTHLLANPVALAGGADATPATPRLFLYPTRAIRRKNLGEFLLWATLANNDDRFAVTLAPENPTARPIYDDWVAFSAELGLPVEFELSSRSPLPFPKLMQRATALVSTSVAEGFGLAFLEPWLMNRPIVGRDLPDITAGFATHGIELGNLYPRLDIPLEWVGKDHLRTTIATQLEATRQAYGRATDPRQIDQATQAAAPTNAVDFGRLDESMQRDVIRRLHANPSDHALVSPNAFSLGTNITRNRVAIERGYNPERYGALLRNVYHTIAASPAGPVDAISTQTLLDAFLDPARFCLLRT